ncbi:hypothetical protein [Lutimonas vermicola]|uniref:Uncharacterized protein n=1 Tax=Lutimonas vermicola TaxID=414288 RepID=A0ABU9L5T5_9FLAO
MKNKIGLLISLLLLGYGLIRIGVGGVLLAQIFEIINFSELNEATLEVKQFINIRASEQIIPFTLTGYFTYILVMGILLAIGAVGTIVRRRWGFILLWIYLAMHAALFINYQEINPKIIVLALQVILLFVLIYLRPPKPLGLKLELVSSDTLVATGEA